MPALVVAALSTVNSLINAVSAARDYQSIASTSDLFLAGSSLIGGALFWALFVAVASITEDAHASATMLRQQTMSEDYEVYEPSLVYGHLFAGWCLTCAFADE